MLNYPTLMPNVRIRFWILAVCFFLVCTTMWGIGEHIPQVSTNDKRCVLPVNNDPTVQRSLASNSKNNPSYIPPTHIRIMGTRYLHLLIALKGKLNTGHTLVGMDGDTLVAPDANDDVGAYAVIPWIISWAGAGLAPTIDFFYTSVVLFSFLTFITGLWHLIGTGLARGYMAVVVTLLAVFVWVVGDVNIFHFAAAAPIPWLLVLIHSEKMDRILFISLFLYGLWLGLTNMMRIHSGTGAFLFLAAMLLIKVKRKANSAAWIMTMLVGMTSTQLLFAHMVTQRDAFIGSQCQNYIPTSGAHQIWHNVYVGFGYLSNDLGLSYSDTVAADKVQEIRPGTIYLSPEYYAVLRTEVFRLCKEYPIFVLQTLVAKAGVILIMILFTMNLGFLAWRWYPLLWKEQLPYWLAIGFNSLFGLLVMPKLTYLVGLIVFCVFFSVVSLENAVRKCHESTQSS